MDRIELRRALLDAILPEVPFDGWSMRALRRAASRAGFDPYEVERVFPGGAREIIEFWSAIADDALLVQLAESDLAALRVRERIALAVKLRLESAAPHKEALRRALSILALPGRGGGRAQMLYRTVDTIWFGIGDRSVDFSFYTKRGLLAGVYGATLLYWLEDRSEGAGDTWAFLDRRIGNVMQIPKLTSRLKGLTERLPNPLRRLRANRAEPATDAA